MRVEICVGATSRLVVEEAARLGVAQIIASRRQVNASGGYTGLTQAELVKIVRDADTSTHVIRDHGGPHQNGAANDDWVAELEQDVAAGFDGLHLDVSRLPRGQQVAELQRLAITYGTHLPVQIQVGGERDSQDWLFTLLAAALAVGARPTHCIIALGGHAHADRQQGELLSTARARYITSCYHELGVRSVAHNMDWVNRHKYIHVIDAVNIAPEYGVIEMDAWLRAVPRDVANELLKSGYDSEAWHRWFGKTEGSRLERARCGMRYIWAEERCDLEDLPWFSDAEQYVRQEVRDAITAG